MRQILLIAGILGGGIPVFAQQTAPPASPPPSTFAESIVVSASPGPTEKEEIPASVTVIDREEIEIRQATNLTQVLEAVPGLTLATAGSLGQQTSLFTRGGESDQTLLLWNGIELNDPYFGIVNWQFLSTEGVERVEVVRGPFSALYGSSALGGVVQVLTGSRRGVSLHAEGGEDGYGRAGLSAGFDLGKAHLDVGGHLRRDDGALPNDRYDGEGLMARIKWGLAPGWSLGLLARADDAETGIPTNGSQPTPEAEIFWEERELALPVQYQGSRLRVDAQLSRIAFDSRFRDPRDPFGFTASDTESTSLRGRAVATWQATDEVRLAAGTEYEKDEVDADSVFGTNLDGDDQRTRALFGQASWSAGPVSLEAGLRHDDNDVYGSENSLRLGGVVRLGPNTRLRASWGEAFRAPSLGELFFPGTGNPDLNPETGTSSELGVEHEVVRGEGTWRFTLTGFDNRRKNQIELDFATFTNVNLGRTRSRGAEAEVAYRQAGWHLRLNGTWLDTEDEATGLALLRRPEESANLFVARTWKAWTGSVEGRYVGERDDVDPLAGFARRTNEDYLRIDLGVRWRIDSRWAPYARVENAADEEYAEVLGYPARGRTWIGGLAFDF